MCSHETVGWARRVAIVEFGPRSCASCHQVVGYRLFAIGVANIALILGAVFCVALSVRLRSWWPYGLILILYGLDRAFLLNMASLSVSSTRRNLGMLWVALLVVFLFVLAKFAT